jgi:hypothetical protein
MGVWIPPMYQPGKRMLKVRFRMEDGTIFAEER